jgi:hyperosmotically inducible periplasmic protein
MIGNAMAKGRLTLLFSAVLYGSLLTVHGATEDKPKGTYSQPDLVRIATEIQKAISTLPQYGVFDDIHFAIKGTTVILRGEASRPTLKSAAENVTKKIEGVQNVENEIEVLPLSQNDDRLRAILYRKIYGAPQLRKYSSAGGAMFTSMTSRTMGITNDPPIGYHAIHIIVKNGNVTLKGAVLNSADSAIAGMQANTTPGVFSVDNDLFVEQQNKKS